MPLQATLGRSQACRSEFALLLSKLGTEGELPAYPNGMAAEAPGLLGSDTLQQAPGAAAAPAGGDCPSPMSTLQSRPREHTGLTE